MEQRNDLLPSALLWTVEAMAGCLSPIMRLPDQLPVAISGMAERKSRD